MGLTTAMYTGLTGMNANQYLIDTIGNNVANVNTTAYKENRANFQNQFSLTLSGGTMPSETSGGTNPSQIGLGSVLGSVQRNMQSGAIETTGVPTDMAIEGDGLFVLRTDASRQAYTRDGTFQLNADNELVSADGYHVQGYGVDDDFNIIPSVLTDLSIPLGMTTARATSTASMDGNLNANGSIASAGTILTSGKLTEGAGGGAATTDTLLSNLYRDGEATSLFNEGDVITIANAKKGERQTESTEFTVTATSTLGDFLAVFQDNLGINQDPALAGTPGITVSADGEITIEGNAGTENALDLNSTSIRSTNANFTTPFSWTEQQEAVGESVFTSFIAYDSLGTPVQVDLTFTLDSKSNVGTVWRYYAESPNDTDASSVLGDTGTISFDNDGKLVSVSNDKIRIDRENTGAISPQEIALDFSQLTGLTTDTSTVVMTTQDGYAAGSLNGFSVGTDGVITGTFSNGLTRTLGQVVVATFNNDE